MNKTAIMVRLAEMMYKISPRLGFSLQYFHHRKAFPNLRNPKDFSEVIGAQMVNGDILTFSQYADKIKVRDAITEWGLGDYLPEVYRVWQQAEDISFDNLPEKFILKTNHGSGGHVVVSPEHQPSLEEVIQHFKESLKKKYNSIMEPQYNSIVPLVYAEEYIDDGNVFPTDYKFMCLDGEIKAILLCFDRENSVHKLVYDENWQKLPYIAGVSYVDRDYPKPENFDTMKEIVAEIASRFTQVRVDLYNAFGRIYIGELTFTADGGVLRNFTTQAIKEMGRK